MDAAGLDLLRAKLACDETGRLVAEARMTGVETERAPDPASAWPPVDASPRP